MRKLKILDIFLFLMFIVFSWSSNAQYKVKEYPLYDSAGYDFWFWDTFTYTDYAFLGNLYYSKDEGDTFYTFFNHLCPAVNSTFANGIIRDKDNEDIIYMSLYNRVGGPQIAPFGRSLDGGKTWEFIKDQFGGHNGASYLFQDAGGTLYINTTDQNLSSFRLYKSIDKGATWQRVEINKGRKKIESFGNSLMWADPVKPNFLYCAWHQANLEGAFLVSRDGGENWERRENGLKHSSRGYIVCENVIEMATQSPQPPYRIYIVNGNGYVEGNDRMAYSDDRGKTWHEFKMGKDKSQFWWVRVNPKNKKMLYAVGSAPQNHILDWGYPFYKSKNGGRNWKRTGKLIDPPRGYDKLDVWTITITENGRILVYGGEGLFVSDDEGETFKWVDKNLRPAVTSMLKTMKGTILISSERGGTYVSFDEGKSFRQTKIGLNFWIMAKDTHDGRILGEHTVCQDEPTLSSCVNFTGSTSYLTEWVPSQQRIIGSDFVYYIGPGPYLKKSDDLGKTWDNLGQIPSEQYIPPLVPTQLLSNYNDPNLLIAAGYHIFADHCGETQWDSPVGGIYLSEDQGYNWQKILGWEKIGSIISLKRDECNPNILVAGVNGFEGQGGVFVSEDFGHTWETRSEGLTPYQINGYNFYSVVVSPFKDGVGYAGVNLNGGIYKTEDYGKNWTKIAENPVHFDDDFIKNFVCFGWNAVNMDMAIPLSVLSMTDILPLDDGKESLLISTLSDGLFIAEKEE